MEEPGLCLPSLPSSLLSGYLRAALQAEPLSLEEVQAVRQVYNLLNQATSVPAQENTSILAHNENTKSSERYVPSPVMTPNTQILSLPSLPPTLSLENIGRMTSAQITQETHSSHPPSPVLPPFTAPPPLPALSADPTCAPSLTSVLQSEGEVEVLVIDLTSEDNSPSDPVIDCEERMQFDYINFENDASQVNQKEDAITIQDSMVEKQMNFQDYDTIKQELSRFTSSSKRKGKNIHYKLWICLFCRKDFSKTKYRNEHFEKHLKMCRIELFDCDCKDLPYIVPEKKMLSPQFRFPELSWSLKYIRKVEHMQTRHHGKIGCNKCEESFEFFAQLDEHGIQEHIDPDDETITCSGCDEIFTTQNSLERHMRICRVETFTCDCTDLPSLLKGEADEKPLDFEWKKQHIHIVHLEAHTCMFCLHGFETKDILTKHIGAMHPSQLKRMHETNLKLEKQSIKNKSSEIDWEYVREIKCPDCKKTFIREDLSYKNFRTKYKRHLKYCPVNRYKCSCSDQPKFTPKRQRADPENLHGKYLFLLIKHKHMLAQHNYQVLWCITEGCIYTCNSVEEQIEHTELKHSLVKKSPKVFAKELGNKCPHCNIDWEATHKLKSTIPYDKYMSFQRHMRFCQVSSFDCDCPGVPQVPNETGNKTNKTKSRAFKGKEQHIRVEHLGQIACKESYDCYFSSESEEILNKHRNEIHLTNKKT